MTVLPPTSKPGFSESGFPPSFAESTWERRAHSRSPSARWIGWRLRGLVLAALLGCLAMFLLLRAWSALPAPDVHLAVSPSGVLFAPSHPGQGIVAIEAGNGVRQPIDALLLQRSSRWLADDAARARHWQQHDALVRALTSTAPRLIDGAGIAIELHPQPRGAAGLGWLFWPLATLALLLYLVTMVVLLSRPSPRNALYAVMALSQGANLLLVAMASAPEPGWLIGFMRWEYSLRTGFDLATVAALVHSTNLNPKQLPGGAWRSPAAWLAAAAVFVAVTRGVVTHGWWWTQGALVVGALVAIAQLASMQRRQPNPLARQLMRFCAAALGTLILLTATVALLGRDIDPRGQVADIGSMVWVLFLAMMLLLLPFLSRTQNLMREFSLLAGVSTVATALDLLFVAVFSLGNFASLTLALFISLSVYAGARQWLLNQMMSRERLTTERMFEQVYRMAREVQLQPRSAGEQLGRLMRELFEPLDVQLVTRRTRRARVVSEGANLVVPVPNFSDEAAEASLPAAVVLGFAERGRRLFTEDDARLADRVVDLIGRAVAFDQAVERGRSEERVRIAQDLHDDIGARLLTLMYQAPTPEMEDYVRHTLKDLKTLTRGLAAPTHLLSHAVAEWKSDISQRVSAADCELSWSFAFEHDFQLSVVQWSALTRVLRELVSNALTHAHASQVEIAAAVESGTLLLSVSDNGTGRQPERWSHGLGLGGVRKRVKQLGGEVVWQEAAARGIECRVTVPGFAPIP